MMKKSTGDRVIMLEVVVRQRELWTSSDDGDEHGVARSRQKSQERAPYPLSHCIMIPLIHQPEDMLNQPKLSGTGL